MWLKNCIIDGISALILLRLDYAPANDTLVVVAELWLKIFQNQPIGWDEKLDAWRVNEAFLTTAGEVDKFPSPSEVLKRLPRRKQLVLEDNRVPVYTPMPQETKDALEKWLGKTLVNSPNYKPPVHKNNNEVLKGLEDDLKLASTDKQKQHIQTIINELNMED